MRPRQPCRLSVLFRSLGREGFLARRWPERPAWSHGAPARLGELRELGELDRVFDLASRSRSHLKAILAGRHHETNELDVNHAQALDLYDAGATIACNEIHRWHPPVADWASKLAQELGLPAHLCGCNLYMSPPEKGLAMHFDDHEVFVVQLAGRKRWRLAPNRAARFPTRNSGRCFSGELTLYASGRPPSRMPPGPTVEMKPGSVLFVPRGYWHTTRALEPSISLSFGIRPPTWLALLRDWLSFELIREVDWREPAWRAWTPDGEAPDPRWSAMRERLARLIEATPVADLAAAFPYARTVADAADAKAGARAGRAATRKARGIHGQ